MFALLTANAFKSVAETVIFVPGALLERYGGLATNRPLTKALYVFVVVGAVYSISLLTSWAFS